MTSRTNSAGFERPLAAMLIMVAGLALAPVSSAQDALGSGDALGAGNALDANPLQGSGGANSITRDWQAEIAYRNAIVTGNVGGGRAFRGSVGYSGVNDFRGALGSDLVYNFQRESFYSGLATRGVRGIDATTIQLQGSSIGQRDVSGAGLIISRPGSGTAAGMITQPQPSGQVSFDQLMAFDRVNTTLRSTSAFTVRDASRPRIVGAASDGQSNFFITASPLGGIDARDPLDPSLISGRSYRPEQFDFDPRISIPGFREQAMQDQMLLDQLSDAEIIAQRMPGHRRVLEDLRRSAVERGLIPAEQAAPGTDPSSRPSGQRPSDPPAGRTDPTGIRFPDIQDIDAGTPGTILDRGPLSGEGTGVGPGSIAAVDSLDRMLREFSASLESAPTLGPQRGSGGPGGLGPVELRRAEDPTDRDPSIERDFTDRTLDRMIELLRDQQSTITRIAPSEDGSLYAQHMRAGERLLGDGMWFIAEERFVAALTARPGDAMAAIGRAHAQLGAGLYLSAAVNLSELFRAYPELITVTYDRALLPDTERLERIRAQLRSRSVQDDPNARNAGFLLAYLGYQTNRPNDVREGFAVVNRVNTALNAKPDPLVPVLERLWAEGDRSEDGNPSPGSGD